MSKRKNGSRLLSAAALAMILGAGAPGLAEPSKVADNASSRAEVERERRHAELRKQGNRALKEGRTLEAIETWREAYKMVPSYEVACAIGRVEMLGRANAMEGALWLTRCVNLAPIPEHGGKGAATEIEAQEKELTLRDLARARVGAIRVVTNEGAEVRVDERALGKAPLADEVFVEPGVVSRIAVSFGEQSRWVRVKLAPGESRTVDLSFPPQPPPVKAPAPRDRTLLITGIAAGVAGLGVAIGFGAAAIYQHDRTEQASEALRDGVETYPCNTLVRPECVSLVEVSARAKTFTVVSVVGLSAVAAGGGIVAYDLLRAKPKTNAPEVQGAFVGAPGGGALVVMGRF